MKTTRHGILCTECWVHVGTVLLTFAGFTLACYTALHMTPGEGRGQAITALAGVLGAGSISTSWLSSVYTNARTRLKLPLPELPKTS